MRSTCVCFPLLPSQAGSGVTWVQLTVAWQSRYPIWQRGQYCSNSSHWRQWLSSLSQQSWPWCSFQKASYCPGFSAGTVRDSGHQRDRPPVRPSRELAHPSGPLLVVPEHLRQFLCRRDVLPMVPASPERPVVGAPRAEVQLVCHQDLLVLPVQSSGFQQPKALCRQLVHLARSVGYSQVDYQQLFIYIYVLICAIFM